MEVGAVTARLGFTEDFSGADRFEARLKKERLLAAKPVKAKLGADYDDRVFHAYNAKLEETARRVAQRERFKAKLTPDFDARAFAAAQREQLRMEQTGTRERAALAQSASREKLRLIAADAREEIRTQGAAKREHIRNEGEKERATLKRLAAEKRAADQAEAAANRVRRASGAGGGGKGSTLGALIGGIGPESQDASKGLHELSFAMRLIRTAGMVAAIASGIAALSALSAAAVAAVSALGPLVGLLATIPAGAGAALQALGTIGLASAGVGTAVKAGLNVQARAQQDAIGSSKRLRAAANQVRDAQDGVTAAHRRVGDAMLGVIKATREVDAAQRALAASGRDVERAQRGVGDAEYTLTQTNVDATDAQKKLTQSRIDARTNIANLARAVTDANRNVTTSTQAVTDAEGKLADAQRDGRDAVKQLTQARKDATRALEDLNETAADARRSEQHAVIDLADARDQLTRVNADPAASARDRQKAALDVADAENKLSDAQRDRARSTTDAAEANKAGVNLSPQVQSAIRGVVAASKAETDAREAVAEAQHKVVQASREEIVASRDLAEAQRLGVEKAVAVIDARRQLAATNRRVLDAEQGIVDAAQAVTDAQQREKDATVALKDSRRGVGDAQRDVTDAQKGVAKATDAVADAQLNASGATEAGTASVNAYRAALNKLSPAQRSFVKYIISLNPLFDRLKQAAGEQLFGGLENGIRSAMKNFGVFETGIAHTSGVLGGLVEKAGELVGSKGFGKDLETQMGRNDVTIRRTGEGMLNLTQAIMDVTIAAGPLVDWITRGALQLTELIKGEAAAGRENGKLAKFFDETRVVLSRVWRITVDLAGSLINIGKLAYPLGSELLVALTKNADKFREWTDSAKGENAIKKYFDNARPAIYEFFKLVDALTRAFFRLGQGDKVAPLIKLLRTELLPVLEQLISSASTSFGPAFIKAISEIIRLFEKLVGGGGPLVVFFEMLDGVLGLINEIIDKIPFIGTALGALIVVGGLSKILGIVSAVSGINGLIKRIGVLRGVLKGTGAVGGVAGGAGAAGGVAGGAGGGTIGKVLGGLATPGTIPTKPLYVWVVNGGVPGKGGIPEVIKDVGKKGGGAGGGVIAGTLGRIGAGLAGGAATAAAIALPLALIKLTEKDWKLDKLTQQMDALVDAPRGTARFKTLTDLEKNLREAVKTGDPKKLSAIAGQIDAIAKSTGGVSGKKFLDLADAVRQMATAKGWKQAQDEIKETSRAFGAMESFTKGKLNDIRDVVVSRMKSIKNHMSDDSAAAKTALSDNFQTATAAIRKSMKAGITATGDGMAQIRKYVAAELKVYGIDPSKANAIAKLGGTSDDSFRIAGGSGGGSQPAGRATGGMANPRGGSSADDHILVDPTGRPVAALSGTEGIVNAPQMGVIDYALGGMASMGLLPGGMSGLDQLWGSGMRHYASGGMIGAANRLEKAHFPYVWGGGHSKTPAPFGPMDCSGAVSYVLQQGGVNVPTSTSGTLEHMGQPGAGDVTVFANPEHTFMRIGSRYFGTSGTNPGGGAGWFPDPGDAYRSRFTQRHFEGGVGGAGSTTVTAPTVKGGGAVGAVASAALKVSAAAASKVLEAASMAGVGTGDAGDPGPGAEPGVLSGFRRAIARAKPSAKPKLALWEAGIVESGLRNLNYGDSTSTGALQLLSTTASSLGINALDPYGVALGFLTRGYWGKGGAISIAQKNPSMSAGMVAQNTQGSAHPERYDAVASQAQQYMRKGGRLVRRFAGGGRIGGALRQTAHGMLPHFARGGRPANRSGTKEGSTGGSVPSPVRTLRGSQAEHIADYDQTLGKLATNQRRYEQAERKYGQSVEVYIDESTGELNQPAIEKRAGELHQLTILAKRIKDTIVELRKIARRIVKTYTKMIAALKNTLKHTKGKPRSGIQASIADAVANRDTRRADIVDLGMDITDQDINITDLNNEGLALRQMTKQTPEGSPGEAASPDAVDAAAAGGDAGTAGALTPDQEAQLAQVERLKQIVASGVFIDTTALGVNSVGGVLSGTNNPNTVGQASPTPYSAGLAAKAAAMGVDLNAPVGGGSAAAGASGGGGNTIIINTLHPGDPATLSAVASASNAGNTYLGTVSSPRTDLGI